MTDAEKAQVQLAEMGIPSSVKRFSDFGGGQQDVLVFDYAVDAGRHRGKTFRVGISFQEAGFPEYPPHFIHVRGDPAPLVRTPHSTHTEDADNGETWRVYSLPPSDFWDVAPESAKHMRTFIHTHMRRIWSES